jgi:PEP-CTERM motif
LNKALRTILTTVLFVSGYGLSLARADFVPWSYNWEPSTLAIKAGGAGTGGLNMTDEPLKHADGTSDIVVTNLRAFSSAARSTPDIFNHAAVSFTLLLKDELSNKSATLTFNGFFNGTISATSSNVVFTPTAPLTQTVKLGTNTYTINLGNYSPPGPPDASNAGSISAHVGVNEIIVTGGGGGNNNAPEPSTLLLSCLGLAGTGLAGWRQWRQRRTVAIAH